MNAYRAVILISSTAILGGLAIAAHQALAASQLRVVLAAAQNREKSLNRQLNRLDQNRTQLAAGLNRLSGPIVARAATGAIPHPISLEELARVQLRRIRATQAAIDLIARPFFIGLGLSSDQIAEAERLMAERNQGMRDINESAIAQGMPLSDPGIGQIRQSELDQFNNQMAALLGPQGFVQYQEFNRVEPAVSLVTQFAGIAFRSGSPLTAEQGERLSRIIANASPEYQNGGPVNPDTVDWDKVQARAQSSFPAQQFTALKNASADLLNRRQMLQLTAALIPQAP